MLKFFFLFNTWILYALWKDWTCISQRNMLRYKLRHAHSWIYFILGFRVGHIEKLDIFVWTLSHAEAEITSFGLYRNILKLKYCMETGIIICLKALCCNILRALLSDQNLSVEDRHKNVFSISSDDFQGKLDPK